MTWKSLLKNITSKVEDENVKSGYLQAQMVFKAHADSKAGMCWSIFTPLEMLLCDVSSSQVVSLRPQYLPPPNLRLS